MNTQLRTIIEFEIHRTHTLGYCKQAKYAAAIKELNTAIANCKSIQGGSPTSYSYSLIMFLQVIFNLQYTDF